jgi:hypothetical protein
MSYKKKKEEKNKINWQEIFNDLKNKKTAEKYSKYELEQKNDQGETFLHAILNLPKFAMSKSDKYLLISSILYKYPKIIHEKDNVDKNTALHIACKNNYTSISRLIINYCIENEGEIENTEEKRLKNSLNEVNNYGLYPISYVLKGEYVKCRNTSDKKPLIKYKEKREKKYKQISNFILEYLRESKYFKGVLENMKYIDEILGPEKEEIDIDLIKNSSTIVDDNFSDNEFLLNLAKKTRYENEIKNKLTKFFSDIEIDTTRGIFKFIGGENQIKIIEDLINKKKKIERESGNYFDNTLDKIKVSVQNSSEQLYENINKILYLNYFLYRCQEKGNNNCFIKWLEIRDNIVNLKNEDKFDDLFTETKDNKNGAKVENDIMMPEEAFKFVSTTNDLYEKMSKVDKYKEEVELFDKQLEIFHRLGNIKEIEKEFEYNFPFIINGEENLGYNNTINFNNYSKNIKVKDNKDNFDNCIKYHSIITVDKIETTTQKRGMTELKNKYHMDDNGNFIIGDGNNNPFNGKRIPIRFKIGEHETNNESSFAINDIDYKNHFSDCILRDAKGTPLKATPFYSLKKTFGTNKKNAEDNKTERNKKINTMIKTMKKYENSFNKFKNKINDNLLDKLLGKGPNSINGINDKIKKSEDKILQLRNEIFDTSDTNDDYKKIKDKVDSLFSTLKESYNKPQTDWNKKSDAFKQSQHKFRKKIINNILTPEQTRLTGMQGQLSNLLDDIIDPAPQGGPKLLDDVFTIVLNLYHIFNRVIPDPVPGNINNLANEILDDNLNNDAVRGHLAHLDGIVNNLNTNVNVGNNLFHRINPAPPAPFPRNVNYQYPFIPAPPPLPPGGAGAPPPAPVPVPALNVAENRWIYNLSNLLFQLGQGNPNQRKQITANQRNKIMSIYKDLQAIPNPNQRVSLITIKTIIYQKLDLPRELNNIQSNLSKINTQIEKEKIDRDNKYNQELDKIIKEQMTKDEKNANLEIKKKQLTDELYKKYLDIQINIENSNIAIQKQIKNTQNDYIKLLKEKLSVLSNEYKVKQDKYNLEMKQYENQGLVIKEVIYEPLENLDSGYEWDTKKCGLKIPPKKAKVMFVYDNNIIDGSTKDKVREKINKKNEKEILKEDIDYEIFEKNVEITSKNTSTQTDNQTGGTNNSGQKNFVAIRLQNNDTKIEKKVANRILEPIIMNNNLLDYLVNIDDKNLNSDLSDCKIKSKKFYKDNSIKQYLGKIDNFIFEKIKKIKETGDKFDDIFDLYKAIFYRNYILEQIRDNLKNLEGKINDIKNSNKIKTNLYKDIMIRHLKKINIYNDLDEFIKDTDKNLDSLNNTFIEYYDNKNIQNLIIYILSKNKGHMSLSYNIDNNIKYFDLINLKNNTLFLSEIKSVIVSYLYDNIQDINRVNDFLETISKIYKPEPEIDDNNEQKNLKYLSLYSKENMLDYYFTIVKFNLLYDLFSGLFGEVDYYYNKADFELINNNKITELTNYLKEKLEKKKEKLEKNKKKLEKENKKLKEELEGIINSVLKKYFKDKKIIINDNNKDKRIFVESFNTIIKLYIDSNIQSNIINNIQKSKSNGEITPDININTQYQGVFNNLFDGYDPSMEKKYIYTNENLLDNENNDDNNCLRINLQLLKLLSRTYSSLKIMKSEMVEAIFKEVIDKRNVNLLIELRKLFKSYTPGDKILNYIKDKINYDTYYLNPGNKKGNEVMFFKPFYHNFNIEYIDKITNEDRYKNNLLTHFDKILPVLILLYNKCFIENRCENYLNKDKDKDSLISEIKTSSQNIDIITKDINKYIPKLEINRSFLKNKKNDKKNNDTLVCIITHISNLFITSSLTNILKKLLIINEEEEEEVEGVIDKFEKDMIKSILDIKIECKKEILKKETENLDKDEVKGAEIPNKSVEILFKDLEFQLLKYSDILNSNEEIKESLTGTIFPYFRDTYEHFTPAMATVIKRLNIYYLKILYDDQILKNLEGKNETG